MAHQHDYQQSWGYLNFDPHAFDNPRVPANQYQQPHKHHGRQQLYHRRFEESTQAGNVPKRYSLAPKRLIDHTLSRKQAFAYQTALPHTVTNSDSESSNAHPVTSKWASPDRHPFLPTLPDSTSSSNRICLDLGRATLPTLEHLPRQFQGLSSLWLDLSGYIDETVVEKLECLKGALEHLNQALDGIGIKKTILGPFTPNIVSILESSKPKRVTLELDRDWMPSQHGIALVIKSLLRSNPSRVTLLFNGPGAFKETAVKMACASKQNPELSETSGVSELCIMQPRPSTSTSPYFLELLRPILLTTLRDVKVVILKNLNASFKSLECLRYFLADLTLYCFRVVSPRFVIGSGVPEVSIGLNCQHWQWVEESMRASVSGGEWTSACVSLGGNADIRFFVGGAMLSIGRQRMVIPFRRLAFQHFTSIVKLWETQLEEMNLDFQDEPGKEVYRHTGPMDVKSSLYHLVTGWAFSASSVEEEAAILQACANTGLVGTR